MVKESKKDKDKNAQIKPATTTTTRYDDGSWNNVFQ